MLRGLRVPAWLLPVALVSSQIGCSADPRPLEPVIHARFDPDAKKIPMPTDILRDDATGLLDLDANDPELTPAEQELYGFLDTLEGWPASSAAKVELTGQLAANSVTTETVQVWEWPPDGGPPSRVAGVAPALSSDGLLHLIGVGIGFSRR